VVPGTAIIISKLNFGSSPVVKIFRVKSPTIFNTHIVQTLIISQINEYTELLPDFYLRVYGSRLSCINAIVDISLFSSVDAEINEVETETYIRISAFLNVHPAI